MKRVHIKFIRAAVLYVSIVIVAVFLWTKRNELTHMEHFAGDGTVRFAVIGDFGKYSKGSKQVARLIEMWRPDFIITTGDNNYRSGEKATIDKNIGKLYSKYIANYKGKYGKGSDKNRFFPTLGNHDIKTADGQPYLDYFTLPGDERNYDFVWGPVHLFTFDSNHALDETFDESQRAAWLKEKLSRSDKPWKIVYMHHPPYTSGKHASATELRWPYKEWGAVAVLSGHNHNYERLMVNQFPYFVNGLGGKKIYPFDASVDPLKESESRYDKKYGAMIVDATQKCILFRFVNIDDIVIDSFQTCRE